MLDIAIRQKNISIEPCSFDLPKFTILTGINGSGKSHLLGAIATTDKNEIIFDGKRITKPKIIGFNSLNPNITNSCDKEKINEYIKNLYGVIQDTEKDIPEQEIGESLNNSLCNHGFPSSNKMLGFIFKISETTSKSPLELTETDLYNNFDIKYFESQNDILIGNWALIFKDYHIKFEKNENRKCRGKEHLSEAEFLKKHGLKPWDFVNSILDEVSLYYKVNNPEKLEEDDTFHLRFIDKLKGTEVEPNNLSTGEKVLVSLALAIYNTGADRERTELLLIDEPDAGLHPSMSKNMINVLGKHISQKNGIPVIITTHSPTTVIAANTSAIYEKIRGRNEPQKISKQEAVNILTEDIPFLKISIEDRRTVFVESEYDVAIYTQLNNIYCLEGSCKSLFVQTKKEKGDGSNCDDVKFLVKKLVENGNEQVYGIIDYDNKNANDDKVIVIGDCKRYAIENYLLDPLLVGLLMLREKYKDFAYFNIQEITKWHEIKELNEVIAQKIVDKVLTDIDMHYGENPVIYTLLEGFSLQISDKFVKIQGHALETLYKNTYPELKKYHDESKKDKNLKRVIINMVLEDFPSYVCRDVIETLKKIT